MIVLDTNVVSALMYPDLNAKVVDWLDLQNPEAICTTVITLQEIAFGIQMMPRGKRRRALQASLDKLDERQFGRRMLVLDTSAARLASGAQARAQRATGHCDVPDALIAGIALSHQASVATRNVRHFRHFGVPLIDPWTT